jgi:hypothetical protein
MKVFLGLPSFTNVRSHIDRIVFLLGKSLLYTLELSQKSDFQHLTTKPDNKNHPTIETSQILTL